MLDGDQVMALIATSWHGCGRLRGNGVVATVMSNLGFERHLSGLGLSLARTAVGDRYVVEYMRTRSEEHPSELQSLMRISYAVFCLKKKKKNNNEHRDTQIEPRAKYT